MQNDPDGDSRNFTYFRNSLCRPAPCIELLEYNGIYGMPFFPYEKNDAEVHYTAIASYRTRHYVRSACVCSAWAKHSPVTLRYKWACQLE